MPDDEEYGAPPAKDGGGGKLIEEDVFLARLAARQEAAADLEVPGEALTALQDALKSLGIIPEGLSANFLANMTATPASQPAPDAIAYFTAEDLAVEELFLSELGAGKRPKLGDYLQRYPQQHDALLRMAARMDPRELAGLAPLESPVNTLTPEAQASAVRGQREGERRALRALATSSAAGRRRRGRAVAEEHAPYAAPPSDGAESPVNKTPRARRARPESSEPER